MSSSPDVYVSATVIQCSNQHHRHHRHYQYHRQHRQHHRHHQDHLHRYDNVTFTGRVRLHNTHPVQLLSSGLASTSTATNGNSSAASTAILQCSIYCHLAVQHLQPPCSAASTTTLQCSIYYHFQCSIYYHFQCSIYYHFQCSIYCHFQSAASTATSKSAASTTTFRKLTKAWIDQAMEIIQGNVK